MLSYRRTGRCIAKASLLQCRSNSSIYSGPSVKTSVLLGRLPSTTTKKALEDSLKAVACKRIELEPSCSLHFLEKSDASAAATTINEKLKYGTFIRSASIPTLLMNNLPAPLSAGEIKRAFANQKPCNVSVDSNDKQGMSLTLRFSSTADSHVLKDVNDVIEKTKFEGIDGTLQASSCQLKKPALFVRNIAHIKDEVTLQKLLDSLSDGNASISANNSSSSSSSSSNSSTSGNEKPNSGSIERVQLLRRSKDTHADMAVVYFSDENSTLQALASLQSTVIDGKRVSATYREVAEPAVQVHNLPSSATTEDVVGLFDTRFNVVRVELNHPTSTTTSTSTTTTTATVVMENPNDVLLATTAFNGCTFPGSSSSSSSSDIAHVLQVVPHDLYDVGITVPVTSAATAAEVVAAVNRDCSDSNLKSAGLSTNINAEVAFLTQRQASQAQRHIQSGAINLFANEDNNSTSNNSSTSSGDNNSTTAAGVGSLFSTDIVASPSYVVEVSQLPTDEPAANVVEALDAQLQAAVLQVDRSALVKFRRHKEVVPGIKALKTVRMSAAGGSDGDKESTGEALQVARYRPLQREGGSEYDTLDYGSHLHANRISSTAVAAAAQRGAPDVYGYDLFDTSPSSSSSSSSASAAISSKAAEFDRFALQSVLQDYMDTDPATRFQIAKNQFERALFDAKATNNIGLIISNDLPPKVQAEARALFDRKMEYIRNLSDEEITQRLFEIFMQKQDMLRLSSDFQDLEKLFGPADAADVFNWSQFEIMAGKDLESIQAALHKADEAAQLEMAERFSKTFGAGGGGAGAGSQLLVDGDEDLSVIDAAAAAGKDEAAGSAAGDLSSPNNSSSSSSSGNEIVIKGEHAGEADVRIAVSGGIGKENTDATDKGSSADPMVVLQGKDGNVWSACILDTDIVQKTMPGNRVNTFRALVVVGNLKGAAGFGMGKGKNGQIAVTAACRAALRNLTHIDLYDNFGLAHDVYGKHNSCHAYIRATPASRELVASPLATEVLLRFGIGSASVKLVGRRNPYSQVRALFNALQKHENIDEYAKERGKRYLTLRWAHERNL